MATHLCLTLCWSFAALAAACLCLNCDIAGSGTPGTRDAIGKTAKPCVPFPESSGCLGVDSISQGWRGCPFSTHRTDFGYCSLRVDGVVTSAVEYITDHASVLHGCGVLPGYETHHALGDVLGSRSFCCRSPERSAACTQTRINFFKCGHRRKKLQVDPPQFLAGAGAPMSRDTVGRETRSSYASVCVVCRPLRISEAAPPAVARCLGNACNAGELLGLPEIVNHPAIHASRPAVRFLEARTVVPIATAPSNVGGC